MLARLAFASATAIRPDILVIDEVLGAGDAYFINKSTERMERLVGGGASVVLVSHALDHVMRFCSETIWLDRGRIVRRGRSLEVVKEYQQYIQNLEDRRLQAKNRKVRTGTYEEPSWDVYSDTIVFSLVATGRGSCDVSGVELVRSGEAEERLLIGDAQDADLSHSSFVILESSQWSDPGNDAGTGFRTIEPEARMDRATGGVAFNLYLFRPGEPYTVRIRYRPRGLESLEASLWLNGRALVRDELPVAEPEWQIGEVALSVAPADSPAPEVVADTQTHQRRWPGIGGLRIDEVLLLDDDERERAAFTVGELLHVRVQVKAEREGTFPVIPVAVLYRTDGILVTRLVGPTTALRLRSGQIVNWTLDWGGLDLGNG
jgi:lipopolysaccharide transport system ATP-binding protein